MKTGLLILGIALFNGCIFPAFGQSPAASGTFRKSLSEQVTILPFVAERSSFKFKPHAREVPDELRAEVKGQELHISGTKKSDTRNIQGLAGWFGKVALSPASQQSGTFQAAIQFIRESDYYGIVLELDNGTLKTERLNADLNLYQWKTMVKDAKFSLIIAKEGGREISVSEDASHVKSFGFYAVVRYPGNKADVTIKFDEVK